MNRFLLNHIFILGNAHPRDYEGRSCVKLGHQPSASNLAQFTNTLTFHRFHMSIHTNTVQQSLRKKGEVTLARGEAVVITFHSHEFD